MGVGQKDGGTDTGKFRMYIGKYRICYLQFLETLAS
jgi:hypothetical protein